MKKIFGIVLSAALLAGCAKEMSEKVALGFTPKDFTASLEATKTDLGTDGHSVLWSTGDRIGVFYKQKNVLVAYGLYGNGGKTTGYFMATDGDNGYPQENEALMYYAIYPFDANATQKEGILTVTLPNTQSASIGFDPNAAVMAAKSNIESLEFQNTEGLLKLVLKHEIDGAENVTVSKIVLTSNSHPLSGLATINAGTDFKAVVDAKGSKTITFNCSNPEPIRIYDNQDTAFHIVVPETAFEAYDLMVSVYFSVSYGDRSSEMSTSFVVPQAFNVKQNEITTITKSINVSASSINGKILIDDSMPDALKYEFVSGKTVSGVTAGGKNINLVVDSVKDGIATFRIAESSYTPSVTDGEITFSFTANAGGIDQKYSATASVDESSKSLNLEFRSKTAVLCVSSWVGAASGKSFNFIEVSGPTAMTVDGEHTTCNNIWRQIDATTDGPVYIAVPDPSVNAISKVVLMSVPDNSNQKNRSAYYYTQDAACLAAGKCLTLTGKTFNAPPSATYSVTAPNVDNFHHNDGGDNDWGFATNGVSLYAYELNTSTHTLNWIPGSFMNYFCSIPTDADGDITFAMRPGNPDTVEFGDASVSIIVYATEKCEAFYQANAIMVSDPAKVVSGKIAAAFKANYSLVHIKNWKLNGEKGKTATAVKLRGQTAERTYLGIPASYNDYTDGLCGNYKVTISNEHKLISEDIVKGWNWKNHPYYSEGTIFAHIYTAAEGGGDYYAVSGQHDIYVVVPAVGNDWQWPRRINAITEVDILGADGHCYQYTPITYPWMADIEAKNYVMEIDGENFYLNNPDVF